MTKLFFAVVALFLSSCSQGAPVEPMLIGGRIPDKGDFQAVISNGGCTASVVGNRVILLAAHCVNTSMNFSVGRDAFKAECMTPLEYIKDISGDFGLCYLDKEVSGIEFENVNLDPDVPKEGDTILLSGFGCTSKGRPSDGQFRVGEVVVTNTKVGFGYNYFETRKKVLLCPGDSGGPAWSIKDKKRDKIVGVNSRSDSSTVSYLSATGGKAFNRFVLAWKKLYPKARICGVDADAPNCFGAPKEELEPTFEIDHTIAEVKVHMKPTFEGLGKKLKVLFGRLLDSGL
jgi:Trypsin